MNSELVPNGASDIGNTKKRCPQLSQACFTLNNYSEKDIQNLMVHLELDKYIFQEEIGTNGTPHLQGVVHFKTRTRPSEKLNWTSNIHWEKCRSWEHSVKYCSDEKKRKPDGKVFINNYVLPEEIKIIKNLYNWQSDIVDYLSMEPDDRTIYWIFDVNGCEGKTQLCKWLVKEKDALILCGKAADMKYGVIKRCELRPPKIVCINVPRSIQNYLSYSGMEEIKDGLFFSPKYESNMIMYNSPHVVVFANEPPDNTKMSMDRWKVYTIVDRELHPLSEMDLYKYMSRE